MLTISHLWIFVLLPLPLIAARLLPPWLRNEPVVRVPFLPRIKQAGREPSSIRKSSSLWKHWIIWILVLTALARPQWIEPPIEKQIPTHDMLLIVDLSGSMEAEDFSNTAGEKTDRLTAAKEVIGDFLLRRAGDRVGLVVFGSAPFLQAPFTTDLDLCRQLLDQSAVRMAGPSTALGDAIGLGIGLFTESNMPNKTIIALTDGNDTASAVPPVEAAQIARDRGITIHTIAMGNPETLGEEKLDEDTLKKVAQTTSGEYFLALDRSELESIYSTLDELEMREVNIVSHRLRRDLYYWPLAAALLFSLAASSNPSEWRATLRRSPALHKGSGGASPSSFSKRLRVDIRTSKLEVTES